MNGYFTKEQYIVKGPSIVRTKRLKLIPFSLPDKLSALLQLFYPVRAIDNFQKMEITFQD